MRAVLTALLACALPVLIAFNVPPSSTFLNQAAAFAGWGLFLGAVALQAHATGQRRLAVLVLLAALAAVGATVGLAVPLAGLPSALVLSSLGAIAAAGLTIAVAARSDLSVSSGTPFRAFCAALQVAALASVAIAFVQYFLPSLPDGDLIARAASAGRVGANLRQPNHLSSLLLAAVAATVWLREASLARGEPDAGTRRAAFTAVVLALVFGVVLSVSRTGVVCIVLLAVWGALDRRLSRLSRLLLWTLPLVLVVFWLGVEAWATALAQAFAGDAQLHKSDLSSSRFGIWSNTLDLILANPWTGVGWGEFNFAWTLTPFPGRPVAFFDHTHNLPLQLLAELGIPLGSLVMALLLYALCVACRKAVRAVPADRAAARAGLVMVLMMGVHSLLEYPLWYAYFLLPTAFAFGIVLGAREAGSAPAAAPSAPAATPDWTRSVLVGCSALLVVGAAYSVVDYFKVVRIFAPGDNAAPLEARIDEGRGSLFFAHHAEYAAVTTAARPSDEMRGFAVATHYLLDARLMVAWSKALAEAGDLERARYVAQRLKEFRHALGDAFFAPCADAAVVDKPFQCTPPARSFTFRDFRGGR